MTNAPFPPHQPNVVVVQQQSGPGCLVQGLWFFFVGWWLGLIVTGLAWMLLVSIIGLPVGLMLLNRLPKVMTLKPSALQTSVVTLPNGQVVVQQSSRPQLSFAVRAVYFVLVGWWLSGIWLAVAWSIAGFTFGLGLPVAFWMFNRVPALITLAQ